jgi:YtkA-like protein
MQLRLPPAARRHGLRPPRAGAPLPACRAARSTSAPAAARLALLCLAAIGGIGSLAGLGCRPPAAAAPEIALAWVVAPDPPAVGAARLSLTLSETATGRPVEGARVRLAANMTHPGMKPVLATAREVRPGRYEAPLALSMAGDWFLLVEARLRDGRTLDRQVDLPGVRSP